MVLFLSARCVSLNRYTKLAMNIADAKAIANASSQYAHRSSSGMFTSWRRPRNTKVHFCSFIRRHSPDGESLISQAFSS